VVQFVDTTCGTKKAAPSQVEGGFFGVILLTSAHPKPKPFFLLRPVPPT
jgi:hypothetical protein